MIPSGLAAPMLDIGSTFIQCIKRMLRGAITENSVLGLTTRISGARQLPLTLDLQMTQND